MTRLVLVLVAAPFGCGLLLLCLRQPLRWALPGYAALMPFGGLLSVGTTRFGSASSLLGIVLGVGLVLHLMSTRRLAVGLSATVPLWLLFLGTAGATVLWSIVPARTANGFLVLSSLVLIYVLVALTHVDRAVLARTENGLMLGGVLATCYGLAQLLLLGGFPSDVPDAPVVPDGRFGNDLLGPNNQAVALILPLLVALSRSVTLPSRSSRLLNGFVSALLLTGILMTGSRGGLLATFIAVVVLACATPRGRAALLVCAAAGVVVVSLVLVFHPAGIAVREVQATSSSGRTDIWRVGLAACPRYCAAGSGWETFPDVYAATQASVPGAQVLVGKGGSYEPHNVWILVAIELGLPGLVLLAGALGTTLVEALRLPAGLRGPPLSVFVAVVVAALFLSNLEFKFFWLALILVSLSRSLANAEDVTPVPRPKLAINDDSADPGSHTRHL